MTVEEPQLAQLLSGSAPIAKYPVTRDMQHGLGDADALSSLLSILNSKEVRSISISATQSIMPEPVVWISHHVCHKRNNYRSSVQSATSTNKFKSWMRLQRLESVARSRNRLEPLQALYE